MSAIWTSEHDARLAELWPSDMKQAEIADELGFSAAWISVRAAALDLPPRRSTTSDRVYFQEQANKRNLSQRALATKILHVIRRDRMVDAILDDEHKDSSRLSHG